jgi:hypothetical protein
VTSPVELPDNLRSFIGATPPRHAVIATVDPDGTPHQVVIWYRFEPGDAGADRLVVNSLAGRRWPTNLERAGRASLAVHTGQDAVSVLCEVERVYGGDAALADISEMARRYYEPDAAERSIRTFSAQQRVTFVLRPTRVHVHGDPT